MQVKLALTPAKLRDIARATRDRALSTPEFGRRRALFRASEALHQRANALEEAVTRLKSEEQPLALAFQLESLARLLEDVVEIQRKLDSYA